jgi:hypothetical protein
MRAAIRVAAIAALLAWVAPGKVEISHAAEGARMQGEVHPAAEIKPMSDDRFWALVQATTVDESRPDRQIAALRASLAQLPVEEIEAFQAAFDGQMTRSYSWDLWGAAYVVHGGASDDGFDYFRCWLISKGRTVFDKVLADPDSLADLVAPDPGGPLEFEEFAYVARKVWDEKVGRPGRKMPNAATTMYSHAPAGTKFEEDPAYLATRYPKLWRRFGNSPLE